MIGKGKLRRAGRAALLICALLLLVLAAAANGGRAQPAGGAAAAEEVPYAVSLLERDITVRENKTLFVTDVFHLKFEKEASVFTYRLPRDLDTQKEVSGRQFRTRSVAYLTEAAVTVNGQPGSCGVSLHSGDYLIAAAPPEGKFSGEQVVSLSYLYDISLDRTGGFDDLTLPLTYGSVQPQELRVTVTFPKSIEGANLAFRNSAVGDESQRTEFKVTFRCSGADARTEPVVMQATLGKGYFVYDSIFSKAGGWYYALFAVALACIAAGTLLFVLKRRAAVAEGGGMHAAELAVIILGFVPVLAAIIVFGVNSRVMAFLPVFFGVFCGIGYFVSYVKWQNARADGKRAKGTWVPSVLLFCLFFLLVYALCVFGMGAYVLRLDAHFLCVIAPVWTTVSRVLLYPLMKKAPRRARVEQETPEGGLLSERAENLRARERKAARAGRKRPVDKSKLLAVGGAALFAAVAAVFISVAVVENQKLAGYVSGEGVVVRYEERLSEDSDGGETLFYHPVVRYEYEGITYTEMSPSGSSQKAEAVGETVEILIDPLVPSDFSLKADRSFWWIIFIVVSAILYMVVVMAMIVPFLDKRHPRYNWGGIFGSTLFIVFPVSIMFCLYFGLHAKGIWDFITKAPWVFAVLAFILLGLVGACYEVTRAAKLAVYRKTDGEKFVRLCEKEDKRFETAGKIKRKLQSFSRGRGNFRQEIQRLDKTEPRKGGTERAEPEREKTEDEDS